MTAKDYCIEWPHHIARNGYGQMRYNGRARYAHRVLYEQFYGPIPKGLVVDHLCGVRSCINPLHMEVVTQRENCRRGRRTSMTQEKANDLRRLRAEGADTKTLAMRFSLSERQVLTILSGQQWQNRPDKLMTFGGSRDK